MSLSIHTLMYFQSVNRIIDIERFADSVNNHRKKVQYLKYLKNGNSADQD